jgi:hypothetical protein
MRHRIGGLRPEVGGRGGEAVDVAAAVRQRPTGDAPRPGGTGQPQGHRADRAGAAVADRETEGGPRRGLVAHGDLDQGRCR